jgi:hypothetical protein
MVFMVSTMIAAYDLTLAGGLNGDDCPGRGSICSRDMGLRVGVAEFERRFT